MQMLSVTVYLVLLTNKLNGQLFDAYQGLRPFIGTSRQLNYDNNNRNKYNNNNRNNNNYDFPSESQILEKNVDRISEDTDISNPKELIYDSVRNDDNNYTSQDENDRNKNNNSDNDEFEDKFFGFNVRPIIDALTRPPKRTVQRRPTQNFNNNNNNYYNNQNNDNNNNYQKSINNDRTTNAPDYYSIITQRPKTTSYDDNNRYSNDFTTQRNNNMRKQQRPQNEYYDSRPILSDSRPEYTQDRYTTKDPYYNRPGIKPIYTQGPPITNRPKTKAPNQRYTERPTFVNGYENNQQTTHRANNNRPDNNYYQRPTTTTTTTTTEYNYYKPTTQRPSFGNANEGQNFNDRPSQTRPQNPSYENDDAIQFPTENDGDPELIEWIGPREETMTRVQKRRFIQLAEKKCQEYKQLTTRKVEAIPLLPSPSPVQVNVSECVPSNVPLIIGGKTVPIAQFPHMAALGWKDAQTNGYSWKCGGSLISETYVLTAAHCAYQDRDNSVSLGPPQAVQLGSSYLDDPGALVVKVAAAMRHPKYALPKAYYDVALIKLARRVSFSAMIKPACLGSPPDPGYPVIATGWGRTENSYETSPQLRGVSISVWDMGECYRVLGTSKKIPAGPLEGVQLCAGEREGGKDTCQGDSGGPIQIQDGCVWRICGITSFGRLCGAAHTPGVYATVDIPFIAAAVFSN